MTDDLVKRLRSGGETCGIDACKIRDAKSGCLCATAADRIEALEAALLFMVRNEEVQKKIAEMQGDTYVNKGLDHAKKLLAEGEKKDG